MALGMDALFRFMVGGCRSACAGTKMARLTQRELTSPQGKGDEGRNARTASATYNVN